MNELVGTMALNGFARKIAEKGFARKIAEKGFSYDNNNHVSIYKCTKHYNTVFSGETGSSEARLYM